jgi:hypothetical protein
VSVRDDIIQNLRTAAREAMGSVRANLGKEDPDKEFYNTLTPEDLAAVHKEIGDDALMEYVKEMEER